MAAVVAAILALFLGGEYVQRLLVYRKARAEARAVQADLPPVGLLDPVRNIVLNTIPEVPNPWTEAAVLKSSLPVYDLRVAAKDLRVLQRTAELVTARSISVGVPLPYVPAEFLVDGLWRPIRVKLRGLYSVHYLKRRPSLRLKFTRDRPFEGKDQINLSDPYDKGLTADVTTNWELARHGILTWGSRFVWLRVNGEFVGLFQEIEQFGRSIPDRHGRSEGFIFAGHGQLFGKEGPGYDKALAAMERLKDCRVSEVAPPSEDCDWDFIDEYLDTDRWAWAAALKAVLGSSHAWDDDNLRIFWDPARGRFEPIPWDYSCYRIDLASHPEGEVVQTGYGTTVIGIPEFRRMRDTRMWHLLTERVDAMIAHADALFEQLRPALLLDTRHLGIATDEERQADYGRVLRDNRQVLMDRFRVHELRAAVWSGAAGRVTLDLRNHGKAFLEVSGLQIRDRRGVRPYPLPSTVMLDGIWFGRPGRRTISVAIPSEGQPVGLLVRNGVTGDSVPDEAIVLARGEGEAPSLDPDPRAAALLIRLENVRVEGATVRFGPGRVRLDRTLEIPASYDVAFEPGLQLAMGDGASLMVYGGLTSLGTQAAPVRVFGAGPKVLWGGILVQGTRTRPSHVRLEHTILQGGTGGENHRTAFTSPFAVHGGLVAISACQFLESAAEDGINLKYCDVDLRNNHFRGSQSDAVDLDFCTGSFVGNTIADVGGDGLDLSGSRMVVEGNRVARCGDKGHSIGEETHAEVRGSVITGCHTGIAVKDSSRAVIRDSLLSHLQVGLSLYVKKPTFGPSAVRVEDVEMLDVATEVVRENTCTLEYRPKGSAGREHRAALSLELPVP
ncbi:MAG: right-handed parallel beta-helix repeat-containing protein [Candidatus Rokubacteria bacterium]|nr:right-handed parallel beta-helix repeat-containing protein [Candidatus Rokubacteria bacterium]